jgi:hypothetical protein
VTIENVTPAAPVAVSHEQRELAEWNEAVQDAAEVRGYSLYGGKENDNKLDALIGVPFVITHMTFREGDIKVNKTDARPRDFVSCEILVHPGHAHKFNRKYVVFNDGSTGIYRQIVKFLSERGDVVLDERLPEAGDAHTTRYDVQFSDSAESPAEFGGNLRCPEGLRKSEYDGPTGPTATWYLA